MGRPCPPKYCIYMDWNANILLSIILTIVWKRPCLQKRYSYHGLESPCSPKYWLCYDMETPQPPKHCFCNGLECHTLEYFSCCGLEPSYTLVFCISHGLKYSHSPKYFVYHDLERPCPSKYHIYYGSEHPYCPKCSIHNRLAISVHSNYCINHGLAIPHWRIIIFHSVWQAQSIQQKYDYVYYGLGRLYFI